MSIRQNLSHKARAVAPLVSWRAKMKIAVACAAFSLGAHTYDLTQRAGRDTFAEGFHAGVQSIDDHAFQAYVEINRRMRSENARAQARGERKQMQVAADGKGSVFSVLEK